MKNISELFSYIWSWMFKWEIENTHRCSKYKLPLPRTCHAVLGEEVIGDKSILVIGDVHGCYDELCDLLSLAEKTENDKQILPVFVGDLIDKGPNNVKTLRKIRSMNAYSVRGNHDEAVLRQILNRKNDPDYVFPEKYRWCKDLTDADVKFLMDLPYTISIPSCNALIVHAGLVPGITLQEQKLDDFIVMRNIFRDNNGHLNGSDSRFIGDQWASQWPGPAHVYFGHDSRRGLQTSAHATGLDTGCVNGKELTGICINGCREKISVKARKVYKPP